MVVINNSVKRVAARHHEACQTMPKSYPEWRNFQFAPNSHTRFFFLYTLTLKPAFKLEYASYYAFYTLIYLAVKKCSVRLLLTMLTSAGTLGGNGVKIYVETTPWRPARELSGSIRRHFLALVRDAKIPVGYARKKFFFPWAKSLSSIGESGR